MMLENKQTYNFFCVCVQPATFCLQSKKEKREKMCKEAHMYGARFTRTEGQFTSVHWVKADLKPGVAVSAEFLPHFRNLQGVAAVVHMPPFPAISTRDGGQGHFTSGWSPAARAAGRLRLLAITENQISPVP